MNQQYSEPVLMNDIASWPSVSLIMPLDTKINGRDELRQALKVAADKVKREFREHYTEDKYMPVLERMNNTIDGLELPAGTKSIAVFASPGASKAYFLDTPAEEKIVIDDSFEIRSLLYAKSSAVRYVILLLSSDHAKAFLVENYHYSKIQLKASQYIDVYHTENTKEKVTNFTDSSSVKEAEQDKFLRKVDTELTELLHKDKLAVFVLGTDRVLGHFNSLTANTSSIAAGIHGNYFEATMPELKKILAPHIEKWKAKEHAAVIAKLEEAGNQHRLATGINETWKAAQNRLGQLLVVEKNFAQPKKNAVATKKLQENVDSSTHIFYTRDVVDEIIEQVIRYGGKVVFVDDDMLAKYDHIALIQYYHS